MKSILRGFLVVAASLSFAVAAGAEGTDASAVKKENENISFNYENNTFTVTQEDTAAETELTVMLVKGDYYSDGTSLADVPASDVYYIGQASGKSYSELFENMGVKYDNGSFAPGVYTMITSGYGMEATRTKLFVGNAVNSEGANTNNLPKDIRENEGITYGTVTQTIRIDEDEADSKYIFVSVGQLSFDGLASTDKLGFIVQKQTGTEVKKSYKSLKNLNFSGFDNITAFKGTLSLGIQLNDIPTGTDVVAIPYVDDTESAQ
ncbi:MAG: hypothetical protein IJ300_06450 [Clostridia bacterium]|nr:hypothetical protein [Clostridia bacterium]